MIDSETVYTDITSQVNHFNLTQTLIPARLDGILAEYGKEMTWDIKARLMGKRELLPFSKCFPSSQFHGITAHQPNQTFLAEKDAALCLLSSFPEISLTMEDYLKRRNEGQDRIWPTVPLLPGIEKLVHHLQKHDIPMALATGSRKSKYLLKTSGVQVQSVFQHFDIERNVVTGDPLPEDPDVPGRVANGLRGIRKGRGKPHPDVFLVAAKECLGRDIGDVSTDVSVDLAEDVVAERRKCLVFEDSIPGVIAAKRAGMNGQDTNPRLARSTHCPFFYSCLGCSPRTSRCRSGCGRRC